METITEILNFIFPFLDTQQAIVVLTFLLTIVAFMADKVRSDIVALCSMAILLTTNVITPSEALAGFSNSAVVMMIGLFIVGGAVFQTGLAKTISGKLLRLAGTDEKRLFFLVMIVTAVVAAFVSNTGTVALLLPIILAMSKTSGTNPAKLMMPLAFASSMGGVLTLIGTPPNLIVDGYLRDNNLPGFSFFDFTPIGIICLLTGLLLLYPLCKLFLNKKDRDGAEKGDDRSIAALLQEYHLGDCVFRLQVDEGHSLLEGRSVGELNIRHNYGITLLEIRRANKSMFSTKIQELVKADTVFQKGDTLFVLGQYDRVHTFADAHNLIIHEDKERGTKAKLDFYEIGLSEVLITPESALVNRPLRAANFNERFNLNVLAVKRNGKYIFDDMLDAPVKAGDMILVHGSWKGIESMAKKSREWVVFGDPKADAESVALDHKAPLAAGIMVAMVF